MSELSDRDVDLIHRIRDTFADIDPVPEEVLAGARAALSWGLSAATPMRSWRNWSRTPRCQRPPGSAARMRPGS